MNIQLLLCESASVHPDGTYSLLRGGISRFQTPADRVRIQGTLLVLVHAAPHESGEHAFSISAIDADGKRAGPDLTGKFTVPPQGGNSAMPIRFSSKLPRHGRYEFGLTIDRQLTATAPFETLPPATGPATARPPGDVSPDAPA